MDQSSEAQVAAERSEAAATDASEITPEQMQHVAGGQDGSAHAKQR